MEAGTHLMVGGLKSLVTRYRLSAAHRRFSRATAHPQEVQAQILRQILAHQARCSYGQDHHFADIDGVRAFQRRVPVVDAAALAPYLAHVRAGEPAVMSVDGPPPIGADSGPPPAALPRPDLDAGMAAWWGSVLLAVPDLAHLPLGVLPEPSPYTDAVGRHLPGGAAGPGKFTESSWEATCRAHAKALMAAKDLGALWVGHPGQAAGLVAGLGAVLAEPAADLTAARLWPKLAAVFVDAPEGLMALPALARFFAGVPVRHAPMVCREALLTTPLWRPQGVSPLAITSHFFEFLDLEGRGGSPARGLPLLPHDLKPGGVYLPVVTTRTGLYRFQLKQAVVCRGQEGQTPLLEPAGLTRPRQPLGDGSVAEYEMRALWQGAAQAAGVAYDFALCTFRVAPTVGLRLFIETQAPDEALAALAAEWETRFTHHLAYRLGASTAVALPIDIVRVTDGWARWAEAMHSQGRSPWAQAAVALDADAPWAMVFAEHMN